LRRNKWRKSFVVATFALVVLGYISIAVLASPMILYVTTLAWLILRVIEVTVVATPRVFDVPTFTGLIFGIVPPIGFIHASSAPFHAVTLWVADMAGSTGPAVLNVLTLGAGLVARNTPFVVFAKPVVFDILTLRTRLIFGNVEIFVLTEPVVLDVLALGTRLIAGRFKIAIFAQPPHFHE
jgi:hypothetical protein